MFRVDSQVARTEFAGWNSVPIGSGKVMSSLPTADASPNMP
jgi:hypothetical protein